MATDDEIRDNLRGSMWDLVRTLAIPNELRRYERLGGIDEVWCQWFDDLYLPGDRLFRSAFSVKSLDALERLNAALLECKGFVDQNDIETIVKATWWQAVQQSAEQALQSIEAEG